MIARSPESALIIVGSGHPLAGPESLKAKMVVVVKAGELR
jgi:hypothetical protein